MGGEDAKTQFIHAEELCKEGRLEDALAILDGLHRELPSSRRVNYQRAVCLAGLGRFDEALASCDDLEGKLKDDQVQALRQRIAEQRSERATVPTPLDPSAEGILPVHDLGADADTGSLYGDSAPAAAAAPPIPATDNVYQVDAVYPLSTQETTVTGRVVSGAFHTGDTVSVLTPGNPPLLAPIARIGSAETPIRVLRQNQQGMLLLRVEPQYVTPGTRLSSSASAEAYAETMVVRDEGESPQAGGPQTEVVVDPMLYDAEAMLNQRRFAPAKEILVGYVRANPNNRFARLLLARVHLEADDELQDGSAALTHVQKVYELGGDRDPAVLDTLATALGANGRPEHGIRYLEHLYSVATTDDARETFRKRIESYRKRFRLGNVWEFINNWGDVVFESGDPGEVVRAVGNGSIPRDAKCRKNRVGQVLTLEAIAAEVPGLAEIIQPPKKSGSVSAIVGAVIGLAVGVAASLFVPVVGSHRIVALLACVVLAAAGAGLGKIIGRTKS